MKCLIIVDMQSTFKAATDTDLQKNIVSKISSFNKKKDLIVFMEYVGHGKTIKALTEASKKHRSIVVRKSTDNGANAFHRKAWKQFGKYIKEIYVCGVNTDACVASTVTGISAKYKAIPVKVLQKCCRSNNRGKILANMDVFSDIKEAQANVRIVRKISA